jgi:hypothetical protein
LLSGSEDCYYRLFRPDDIGNREDFYIDEISEIDASLIAYIVYIPRYIKNYALIPQISGLGRFCILNLNTSEKYCPIEGLDIMDHAVLDYSFSPDNRFAVIELGTFHDVSQHILIALNGKEITDFLPIDDVLIRKKVLRFSYYNIDSFLWRPLQ